MHHRALMSAQAEPQRLQGPSNRSGRSSSAFGGGMFSDNAVTRVKRLDNKTKTYINGMLRRAEHRAWCLKHGKTLPPPRLHPVILRVIREWFDLVDDDGSGTLEHHELLAALQAARIPCDSSSISEMIKLMDANRDGCIGWGEFEAFMMDEFAAGKHLLSGEYVLPSGMALPFGVMIRQLKRTQMMKEITQGGETRRKWLHYNVDLSADARAVAEQEEAIRNRKAYNETLHNREVIQVPAAQPVDSDISEQQQQANVEALATTVPSHRATSAEPAARRKSTTGRPSTAADEGATAAAAVQPPGVTIVAGVPVVTAGVMTSLASASAQQQQQRRTSATSMLASMHATAAAAAQTAATTAAATGVLSRASSACVIPNGKVLPLVPRLQLSCVTQSTGDCNGYITAGNAQATPEQRERGASAKSSGRQCNVVIEPGSVLASARTSYWLVDAKAGEMKQTTAAAGGSSVAQHLYQQVQQSLTGSSSPNYCCYSSRAPSSAGGGTQLLVETAVSTTAGRSKSPGRPHHVLQPQPCRNEWGVLTASSIAHQHSMKCRQSELRVSGREVANGSQAGASSTCSQTGNSKVQAVIMAAAAVVASAAGSPQQQPQQQQKCALKNAVPLTARASSTPAQLQAAQAAQQAQQSGCRDVYVKHLLSARRSPPAALLSPDYVGPIEAAVAAAHTPRQGPAAVAAAAHTGGKSARNGSYSQRARTADACCSSKSIIRPALPATSMQPQQPRSARSIVATNAGDAVTLAGRVMQYLPSPQQCVSTQSAVSKSARVPEQLCGGARGLWDASEQWQLECAGSQHGRSSSSGCTAAVAVVGNSGSSSSTQVLHSPRHSVIAQKLVKVHSSYARASLAPQHSPVLQQDDATLQHGNIIDGSSAGSSSTSSRRTKDEQQQQRTTLIRGAPSPADFSSACGLVTPEANPQLPHKQRKGTERSDGQALPGQHGLKLPCACMSASSDFLSRDGTAAAAISSGKRHAAAGPLGGHHPAYSNSYMPSTGGARCSSNAGSQTGGGGGMVDSLSGGVDAWLGCGSGFSACGSAASAHSSPRLSYSGLSPRGRRA